MENTYWNSNGKYQKELDNLRGLMPGIGMTSNQYMNLYITASKVYYDVHNNGGCNLADCYDKKIRDYIMPFSDDIKSLRLNVQMKTLIKNFENEKKLEAFMDEIILYLQDKDLTCKKYIVFHDWKNKELCMSEKEGFKEVSFGNKEDYDEWVTHRIDSWKYTLVE
ncbi:MULTISPECIES: hypothetical protein [Bacillus cereus group]|uniref:Uncharacterized protein n=1 Tax=Bacillus thuringiensis TaxID=1428 RepID=A0A9X6VCC5_BACTU|nr:MULTISPECIES: hypothetical protein [Bacillus cereus group]MEC3269816.1 hypothetical protein [Bacillus thuringiensis]PFB07887.1 hypothetical protein CN398_09120 [Bacillus thuringiensis]